MKKLVKKLSEFKKTLSVLLVELGRASSYAISSRKSFLNVRKSL